ncbi:calcium/proton exchanger [Aphanomyces invadans]|uniref:Calcium/proton exchanger n=1 Tax=Aphanomyces invadans TaxID=157072 RepID=A0A024TE26_9STRA|nr:calcium/proton exchanger [Aphanomyces invadans]ETV91602.1 calcium/proton exchanger [Aphanomyces invadans]|eukprot:XP_008879721.1 calcium/proton exchanger [Aphanomyces invadans]
MKLLTKAKEEIRAAKESTPLLRQSLHGNSPPTLAHSLYVVATDSYINVLLVCLPFAIYSYYAQWGDAAVFAFNFLTMIPLAKVIGDATEEVAFHTGDTIGGLVNATFGNAVEVIIAIFALREGQISVVQASLLGSILSNLLLVLGCCFVAGGVTQSVSKFNETSASANSSLLMVSAFAMLVPSYYQYTTYDDKPETKAIVLGLSHIAAVFLLLMYMQLLYFQMKTHAHLFNSRDATDEEEGGCDDDDDDDATDHSNMTLGSSIVILGLATVLVSILSEYLVASIDGFVASAHVSKSFVGIIILPIVGNAVEHMTAVRVALKHKMELAMGVAVGSATQISLFVVPVTVLAGWAMDQPMSLAFPTFEAVTYVTSVVIVYAIIVDGKSHWLEGSMLLTIYLFIAVALLWVHV